MLHAAFAALALVTPTEDLASLDNTTIHEKTGYAHDAATGELVYVEHHSHLVVDGQTVGHEVRYTDPEGALVARKQLDYRANTLLPDFVLEDVRNGYVEGMARRHGDPLVFCRKGREAELKIHEVDASHPLADAGFDRLIDGRWDDLLAGKTIKKDFLVPALLDTVRFKIEKVREYEADGEQLVQFRMRAANPLVRMLADPINVVYDARDRMLVEYHGVSNLRDANLKNYKVSIHFPMDER
ncbi:MAG: hypothetical protein AAGE01_11835, partial [Pseudomonadota bacterium]